MSTQSNAAPSLSPVAVVDEGVGDAKEALTQLGRNSAGESVTETAAQSEAKEVRSWFKILLSYAARCKGKMVLSLVCSLASVVGGFVPFYCVYRILQEFMDVGYTPSLNSVLFWVGVGALAYVLSKVFFGLSTVLSHISAYTILATLRADFVEKLMKTSLGTVTSQSVGAIKNVFVDRIEGVEVPLAHLIPELSGSLALVVGIAGWLLLIDWRLALSCLVTIPLGLLVFATGLAGYNKMYAAYMEESNHVNSVIVEYIEGIEVVKVFNQTSGSYAKYAQAVLAFKDFTMGWFKSTWVTMNLAFSVLPTTLLGVVPCGLWLYMAGDLQPAMLALAIILALAVVPPLMKLTAFLNEAKSMEFAVADAEEFLQLPELPECLESKTVKDTSVQFRDVRFSYDSGHEVIHGIDLVIPQGSYTALVGPSGSGKSTLARLLARHWDVESGVVAIGGVSVCDMPLGELASLVSYVAQDNYLFDCSLRENIRLGKPEATDEEVERAAQAACCEEFIRRLPQGLDTPAGEAGTALSGGERQRISLARAILKDAPIVVLDEATAFTDPENEDKIQRTITELAQGKTLIVIAHRLSTIQRADQIAVLDGGQISAVGTHRDLLRTSPLYRSLWEAHTQTQEWAQQRVAEASGSSAPETNSGRLQEDASLRDGVWDVEKAPAPSSKKGADHD